MTVAEQHARVIDGAAHAASLRSDLAGQVAALAAQGIVPGLAVVLVGDDPASGIYVRAKHRQTLEVGMRSFEHRLQADTAEADLLALISDLNADPSVHGILVQLPLPAHMDSASVIDAIDPAKDVDGFHVTNAGRLATGLEALVPCTPVGCMALLRDTVGDLRGSHAVVVGRSNIVGKPMAQLLLQADCSVTTVHRWTRDIAAICRQADILVVAVGQAQMVKADWVKPGAVVIDVGINRVDGRIVGDVDAGAALVAGALTPVPGGVGPMTIACLLANTLTACRRANGLPQ